MLREPRATRPAILLLGGTSEIGLAILAALDAAGRSQVLLAGRDEARLTAAGKELPFEATPVVFDALALDTHQAVDRRGLRRRAGRPGHRGDRHPRPRRTRSTQSRSSPPA